MKTNTPADWTDAEIVRWMAERDGYSVYKEGGLWWLKQPDKSTLIGRPCVIEEQAWLMAPPYPRSLDAAVAWLGRRGFQWEKRIRTFDNVEFVIVYREVEMPEFANQRGLQWRGIECVIIDTCTTARALCNAGVAAEMAREASNG